MAVGKSCEIIQNALLKLLKQCFFSIQTENYVFVNYLNFVDVVTDEHCFYIIITYTLFVYEFYRRAKRPPTKRAYVSGHCVIRRGDDGRYNFTKLIIIEPHKTDAAGPIKFRIKRTLYYYYYKRIIILYYIIA